MVTSDRALVTPLVNIHKQLKAKMVNFGGWLMPVSYSSVLQEHRAVREACGLFDVSHMGEVLVTGAGAEAFLQGITINDITRLRDGSGQYSAILNEHGGMLDDLIIYRLQADRFLICVNASNADADFAWIYKHASALKGESAVKVSNESSQWCQIAIQGPNSQAAVGSLIGPAAKERFHKLQYTEIMPIKLYGSDAWLARTGYTGEHGYEIYLANEVAERTWYGLMETHAQTGIQPIGLGARDTLRLEACYLLYGNDMDTLVSPLEAGIGWATKLNKGDFIGRAALVAQRESGLKRQQFAFVMADDGIPRHGMDLYKSGVKVGVVTSGSVLPTVGGAGGLALLDPKIVAIGDTIEVDIRGKRKLARLVEKPLYKAKVKG